MHAKVVKILAKIKHTKINMQTIKQAKLIPTRQGVPQWSCHPKMGRTRDASSDSVALPPFLAGGKQLLESFLVLQGRLEHGWWRKRWLRRGGGRDQNGGREGRKKNQEERYFFLTLASNFSSLEAWNPPLFIRGRRVTCCLLWCQILALYSNQKVPNRWFIFAIMNF